jgi:hypothetical protein
VTALLAYVRPYSRHSGTCNPPGEGWRVSLLHFKAFDVRGWRCYLSLRLSPWMTTSMPRA